MPTVLVVQHEDGCPPDRLGAALAAAGVELRLCRPYAGDPVPACAADAGAHGLLVLGGSMGAGDDGVARWLPATRSLLRAAVRDEVPTLGVCLGGQLLAAACGGRVRPGRHGLEAGVLRLAWRPEAREDALFSGAAPLGPSMHRDEVTELPAGAVWLAQTDAYPHQAFRVGRRAWGVQFHPEVSAPTFRRWAEREAAGPGPAARLAAELEACDAEVQAAAVRLAGRLAALLSPGAAGRAAGGAAGGRPAARR